MAKRTNATGIRIPNPAAPQKITFSFEYYDNSENRKYCLSKWPEADLKLTMTRLKEVSELTHNEMCQRKHSLHFHPVNWSSCTESGFTTPVPAEMEPYQFSLVGINYSKARVFGAYYRNVFYVVWFDLEHKIWPTALKNT